MVANNIRNIFHYVTWNYPLRWKNFNFPLLFIPTINNFPHFSAHIRLVFSVFIFSRWLTSAPTLNIFLIQLFYLHFIAFVFMQSSSIYSFLSSPSSLLHRYLPSNRLSFRISNESFSFLQAYLFFLFFELKNLIFIFCYVWSLLRTIF